MSWRQARMLFSMIGKTGPSIRKSHWPLAMAGIGLTVVLLFGAVTVGIDARLSGRGGRLASGGDLDYSRGPVGGFAPLRAGFIESTLGQLIPFSVLAAGSGERSLVGGFRRSGADSTARMPRIIDEHTLSNDQRGSARAIPGIPFTARTRTVSATREASDPSDCASAGTTVWYRFAPTEDRALLAYSFGTDHAVSIGVYTGQEPNLTLVACDTDTAGNALVAFAAKAGEAYLFQITAPLGGGNLAFSLDPHGTTSLASRSSSGDPANGGSGLGLSVSADGRYVAFTSSATNLAAGVDPTPCRQRDKFFADFDNETPCPQVYVHDRLLGATELVSSSPSGEPADSVTLSPFISASGRYVVFESPASNLVTNDDFGWDLFVYDRQLKQAERIPATGASLEGAPADWYEEQYGGLFTGTISDDGRYVAFESAASDLVAGGADTNEDRDVFVYDRSTRRTERVSVSSSGKQMTNRTRTGGLYPSISSTGRFVEFLSDSNTLVDGDANGLDDVFIHDRVEHTTERVSVSLSGGDANSQTWPGGTPRRRISNDGRYVAFVSTASNLVVGDTNGAADVFVRDRGTGTTIRVSPVASAGDQPVAPRGGPPWHPSMYSISSDGRYVAFDSNAANIAPGDAEQDWDVFLHDLATKTTILVTLSNSGGDVSGRAPAISADAGVVAYVTGLAAGLVEQRGGDHVLVYESPRRR